MFQFSLLLLSFSCSSEDPEVEVVDAPPPLQFDMIETVEEPEGDQTITTALHAYTQNKSGQVEAIKMVFYGESLWNSDIVYNYKESDASDLIDWSINPEISGSLYLEAENILRFVPNEPLLPNSSFDIQINKMTADTSENTVTYLPSDAERWKQTLVTPPFKVVYVALQTADYSKDTAKVTIQLSHDIETELLKNKLKLQVGNLQITRFSLAKDSPGTFTLEMKNAGRLYGKEFSVNVAAIQYPDDDSQETEPYAFNSSFVTLKPIELHGPFVKETASGFTLEFICDDSSVKRRRWHWDSAINFDKRISERCAIDTQRLQEAIEFSPSVSNVNVYPRERGFAVIGSFEMGHYDVTIPSGVTSQDGGMITEPISRTIDIPLRQSSLRFFSQGRYLPTAGWANIHYQHRNVNEMILSVREVPKNNLHNWLANSSEAVRAAEGDLILRKVLSLDATKDRTHRSVLNLDAEIPERKPGLYELTLKDKTSNASTSLRLQVTDISLLAKRINNDEGSTIWAWAFHSRTNQPLPDTTLSLITPAGTVTNTCITDAQGSCSFSLNTSKENLLDPAYALYAERTGSDGQEELAYLTFNDLKVGLGLYNANGASGSEQTYRISAHSDRGAYRPGDEVYLSALLRNQENQAPTTGLPVQLRIVDGRDQQVQKYTLETNAAGVISQTISIPDYAATGSWKAIWEVEKTDGASGTLGNSSYSFRVENLMPERMAVQSTFEQTEQMGGASLSGSINARYLFGSPAAAAGYSVRCEVISEPFSPRLNSNYTFGTEEAFQNFYLGTVEGTLDEEGKGYFTCPGAERTLNLPGMARVIASVDVMEGGSGRSTHSKAKVTIHPSEYYIGLQIGTDEIKANAQYPISGIIVDWEGNRITTVDTVDMQSSQIDYSYNWYYDEEVNEYRRASSRFELPLQKSNVPVKDGFFQFSITGEKRVAAYRIRAENGNIKTLLDVSGEEYSWYYSDSNVTTPDPFRPDVLDISTPSKANLQDPVTVTTVAPYAGRVLWTVERNNIIRQEWMDVSQPGEISWTFDLAGLPYENNVYVSAFLVKDPHGESSVAYMPSRAFGLSSIPIRIDRFNHDLKVSVPEEVQANSTLKVSLDLGESVEADTVAMIAVVDEGLLSLTGFASPDPTAALFPKQPLALDTFETIGWSIASPSLESTATAGGGAGQRRKAQVVKPVSLWSGIVDVPESGQLEVPFTVPQYSGQVRVMVITSSPTRFASAAKQVFVRDPLTMQATLPRFLTKGDQFQVPVFLTNLSGEKQQVEINLTATDGETSGSAARDVIRFLGKDKTSISIDPDEQITVAFQAEALVETGFATFEIQAKAGSLVSVEKLEVPFLSQKPTEVQFTKIQLSDLLGSDLSGSADITKKFAGWTTEDSTVWATNNPYSDSLVRVRDLVRYPYGCIEQTSSSLRPLLTAGKILQQVDPGALQGKPIDKMVEKGLARLASMQTSDGGLAYWPGGSSPHPWGTSYATHVLLDARDAGYTVMPEIIDNAVGYLERVTGGSYDYGYYSYSMPSAKPYAHYILARLGKGKPVAIRTLLNNKSTYSYESEYMLKAALFLSGDRTYTEELKSLSGLDSKLSDKYDHWSFRSRLRSKGMILALHQEMFGINDEQGENLANDINNTLLAYQNKYLSTQSLGWTTYALSKRVLSNTDWKAPTLQINGTTKSVASNNDVGSSWNLWDIERSSEKVTITGQGKDGYVLITSTGIRNDGAYQFGDRQVSVSRSYLNPDGTPFKPEQHEVGQEVVIQITLSNLTRSEIHELALVDRIPAGWEINNPALNRGSDLSAHYNSEAWNSDYMSMKDTQLEIFGDLKAGQTVQFVYTVRATSAGEFFVPPISVESMYNDNIWSRKTGMNLSITGHWDSDLL